MIAKIEIHRAEYPDPKAIILTKEHDDINVLRHWQSSILDKQNGRAMVIGSIDTFEGFISGRREE
jgi:hypothetical protein